MIILLSPAKNLNFEAEIPEIPHTEPRLQTDTSELLKRTKKLSRQDIASLMKLSADLSDLNFERYQALSKGLPEDEAKPALYAFNGDVYRGFDAASMSAKTAEWAQDHVRILSGLYGLLRPMDLIHPYRLEMGTRLDTKRGANLYEFWGEKITTLINDDMRGAEGPVVNLASNEYFSSVKKSKLNQSVIDVAFKEETGEKSKIISFYAKFARGLMARWICDNRITDPEDLKTFSEAGYSFAPAVSNSKLLTFTRPRPDPKA
ncbi:peroxide stress protein YaaA [Ponticaulis sp.]|uniref:peroxide stress protein YaaA n=1 Tax=Ponticaulis sp. TaxID=2020902 RepID=UPI000B70348B|nr:peroxide stress protein YaaA [Ponticaulis sp.]MAI89494.1 peroxide stress protein YaaA [Ponticaulis sp.]OUY00530.1 MAG: hypothetical protein CBB65_03555 [Hyphomonadaceae bacterium TMED5]|tara:strand:+ start:151735 stop:152517 length:783 start_codon:yes stop_codon:yes gene_type:complete